MKINCVTWFDNKITTTTTSFFFIFFFNFFFQKFFFSFFFQFFFLRLQKCMHAFGVRLDYNNTF